MKGFPGPAELSAGGFSGALLERGHIGTTKPAHAATAAPCYLFLPVQAAGIMRFMDQSLRADALPQSRLSLYYQRRNASGLFFPLSKTQIQTQRTEILFQCVALEYNATALSCKVRVMH